MSRRGVGLAKRARSRVDREMRDMTTSRNLATRIAFGVAIALLGALVLFGAISLGAATGEESPAAPSTPPTTMPPALADGERFGFVSVVREGERLIVSFDEAEMLTGDAARQAAVEADVIEPGEDLPNDFFIFNPDEAAVELRVASGAEFFVISGTNVGVELVTDISGIESLYSGSYGGPPVYGIVPASPIVMQVDISGGELVEAHAVYLP